MDPPTGPPLTEADLKVGLLREVDLFAGLSPAELPHSWHWFAWAAGTD